MASSSSSSLPLPSTHHQNQYTYEVFLSFRGKDTRCNFTDHLHRALIGRGIRTFRDNEKLNRGEDISQELLKAIEESRVSIIVFSQNYASSRWCLDELVQILECKKSKGQEVRPVFYKVDPSDVRNQRGTFGDGFAELDQSKYEDKICNWRKALKEAADLSGCHYKDGEYEAKFIDDIVDELSARVLIPSCMLHVAKHPIGLESSGEDVNRLLDLNENVVRMVGIWGLGGIGKTTIAKYVFNSIRHKFESSCFLADVRSNSNGLAQLQETLLSRILGDSNLKISSVDEGVSLIKTRMQRKKVLIILDDVSHSSQLEKLVPSHDCFGRGSRILITTRDKGCLREVDEVYEVKSLDDCQAMNLFSLNAFRTIGAPSDYLELAQRAIRYAQGLPLALIVLGSHLFRRSRDEWEATIGSCRGDPHTDIRGVLRLSYDALGANLKEAFLDIACFFKGEGVERVKPILQACYGFNSSIEQLQERALLRIDVESWGGHMIWMHDLIEEMGEEIANPEGKPDESTRLWRYDDVKRVLSDNTGTKKIKGIYFKSYQEIYLNVKSFLKMKNLRYIFSNGCFIKGSTNIDRLSNELRWLQWHQCPLQSFPSNFHPHNLVKLDISRSHHITRLWDGCKNLRNLKYMDLSGCESLRELPDLSGIPNLIELRLVGCKSLIEIHHSIGSLDKLEILDLERCTGLPEFPKIIGKLDSLRELNLSLTGVKWRIDDEKQLWLDLTTLSFRNLEILNLWGCSKLVTSPRKASISPDDDDDSGSLFLPKLREFDINQCKLSSADFIGDLDCLETLNILDLSFNNFVTLPALGKFVNLSEIYLNYCKRLREIPELPPNILEVDASGCESLERFSMLPKSLNTNLPNLKYMDLSGCESLRELPDLSGIPNLIKLRLSCCESLAEIPHSIGSLDKLEILHLEGCTGLQEFPRKASISPDDDSGSLFLPKLREFYLGSCKLSSADFIGDLDCLETLNNLDLSGNNFVTLPALGKFVNLSEIYLNYCKRLREIPELPPNILEVEAEGCESLERFSMLPKSLNTVQMNLRYCNRFSECLGNDMKMMENILVNNQDSRFSLVFPSLGCEVPKWFQYCSKEVVFALAEHRWSPSTCAVSFEIPSKLELEYIAGVAVICSVGFNGGWEKLRADLSINGVHMHQYIYELKFGLQESDKMWVGYIPLSGEIKGKLLGQWPYKCRVEFEGDYMKSCGVHLVCQPPNENSNKMVMADEPVGESGMHTERKRPHTGANDDYHHQLEQQDQPLAMIPSKRHCTEDELSRDPIDGLDLQLTLATPGFQ